MGSGGFRTVIYTTVGFLFGAAAVVVGVFVCGAMVRFDVALGSVVLRSQAGMSFELPVPEDGTFAVPTPGPRPPLPSADARPVNVVLVIGDGMGLGMVSAASALLHGPAGGLAIEAAPEIGLMKIFAADALVTDSAASATALATGHKTDRKVVSILPDGRVPETLFEKARTRGLMTGVVTTSGLMDATPAGFTAHNVHRDNYAEILVDQLGSGTDVMIGASWGLLDHPRPEVTHALAAARERGATIVTSAEQLQTAAAPLVALFPPRADSPNAGGPPLDVSVRKALAELSSGNSGFMLVVESEETDEWGHDNDVQRIVAAIAELDAAVREILLFADSRRDTLVVVTADHDTGGMGLVRGRAAEGRAQVRWTTDGHVGNWVPLFAFGPGADQFAGVLDNTEIAVRIAALLSL